MEALFTADLAQSRLITLTDWRKRPITDRLLERFVRPFEYWL